MFYIKKEMLYESVARYKNQNSEEKHTNALLFSNFMGQPKIREDKIAWLLESWYFLSIFATYRNH
jgi:hypothetical protein